MRTVVFIQNRDFFGTRLIHLPFLDALTRQIPHNEVIVFSPYPATKFFADAGIVNRVYVYRRGILEMRRTLRRIAPDMIVSLRAASFWLNIAIALSNARVRLGYATGMSKLLFTATVRRNTGIYRALNYGNLFARAGLEVDLSSYFRELASRAPLELPQSRDFFCLMPGGGAGDGKRWGIDNFVALCERIGCAAAHASFIFVLGPDEREYVAQIHASPIGGDAIVLINESVAICASAVSHSRATIANDCGPAHIAQMLGLPCVVIFSNDRGEAHVKMREWFYPRENAMAITNEPLQDIKTIAVDTVVGALNQVLEKHEHRR